MNDKDIFNRLVEAGWTQEYLNRPLNKYYRFKVETPNGIEYFYLDKNSDNARICMDPKYAGYHEAFKAISGAQVGGGKSGRLLLKSSNMRDYQQGIGRTGNKIPEFFPIAFEHAGALGKVMELLRGVDNAAVSPTIEKARSKSNTQIALKAGALNDGVVDTKLIEAALSEDADNPTASFSERSQGYEADPIIRRSVEQHAVAVARDYYQLNGYEVTEFGKPFDLLCKKLDDIRHVEVKGSRYPLVAIIVTINEVGDARAPDWRSDLFLVDKIDLAPNGNGGYSTKGGRSRLQQNWAPEDKDLRPTQFRYQLPSIPDLE